METNTNISSKDKSKLKVLDSVTLKDGTTAKINDFVYVESPTPGDFYQVVRIMRFVPYVNKRDSKCEVQHFYRRHNTGLSWSPILDPKKLYITLATEEINPSFMVSKCYVNHLHYIYDKESYLRLENHFYFSQFYDRLQSKVYPAVPTETITNFPEPTLSKLKQMFSFVFSERRDALHFNQDPKYCLVCKEWCDRNKSVHCMLCEEFYHKACCNPPINMVMPKGFTFQCSTCLANAKVDFEDPSQVIPKINKAKSINKSPLQPSVGTKKTEIFRSIELKCTEYQQIRYIGEYADLNQLTNPHYTFHVVLPVPVSSQIQLNTPAYLGHNGRVDSGNGADSEKLFGLKEPLQGMEGSHLELVSELPFKDLILAKTKAKQKVQTKIKLLDTLPEEAHENGDSKPNDQNILINFETPRQQALSQTFMSQLRTMKFSIPTYTTQFVMHSLRILNETGFSVDLAISKLQAMTPVDFGHYSSLATTEAFENALIKYETDFEKIAQEFPPMTRSGAVQKFYEWKGRMMQKYSRSGLKLLKKHPKLVGLLFPDHVIDTSSTEQLTIPTSSRQKRRQHAQVAKKCLCCHSSSSSKWFDVSEYVTPKSGHALPTYCSPCYDYFLRHATPKPLSLITKQSGKSKGKPTKPKKSGNKRIKSVDGSDSEPLALKVLAQERSLGTSAVSESNPSPQSSVTADLVSPALSIESIMSASHLLSSGIPEQLRKLAMEDNGEEELEPRSMKPKFRHGCMACLLSSKSPVFNPESLLTCSSCHYQVHVYCYPGLNMEMLGSPWTCRWCTNLKEKTEVNTPNCRSCCQTLATLPSSQALFPTKENGWVHLLCLVFNPKLYYDPKDDYRIGNVVCEDTLTSCHLSDAPSSKYQCKSGGMTVQCYLCPTQVHPYCALLADFKVGFVNSPSTSQLTPAVICPNHAFDESKFNQFQPLSATRPDTAQSLLSLYLHHNKRATLNPSYDPPPQGQLADPTIRYGLFGRSQLYYATTKHKLCSSCSCELGHSLYFVQNGTYTCNQCYRDTLDIKATPPRSPIHQMFSTAHQSIGKPSQYKKRKVSHSGI